LHVLGIALATLGESEGTAAHLTDTIVAKTRALVARLA
jgi:hypothetical protein